MLSIKLKTLVCIRGSQIRMVDGSMWLSPEGPYKTLSDLWDDPEEDERLARMEQLMAAKSQL